MTITEIKQLQDKLVREGYMSQAEVDTGYGIFGPKTTAALNAAESGKPPKYPVGGGTTSNDQPYSDEEYNNALNNHPIVQQYTSQGNSADALAYAAETGDYSGLVNQYGQPFSVEEQQQALRDAEEENAAYFDALKQKETSDAENALAQKQADYQNYLLTSGEKFQTEKTGQDQTAADQGVLFSGGRIQKQKQLQSSYEADQAYKQGTMGRDISSLASDYQYKYGNDAAKGLSSYYKLGGNTYNPGVATGGVGSSGLSSVYRPSQYDYKGTRVGERAAAANKGAASRLWNKGNKLLASGYNNQY